MSPDAEAQPLDVQVVNGDVVMTGPRVAVTLNKSAATETARRLMAAAQEAGSVSQLFTGTAYNDS